MFVFNLFKKQICTSIIFITCLLTFGIFYFVPEIKWNMSRIFNCRIKIYNFTTKTVPLKPLPPKLILFWTKICASCSEHIICHKFNTLSSSCPYKCNCSFNRARLKEADSVIITPYMLEKNWTLPKHHSSKQRFVMFARESPMFGSTESTVLKIEKNFFNLTITYRSESDYHAPYGRMIPIKEENNYLNFKRYNWEEVKNIVNNKTKAIFKVFSKCNTPGKRENYIRELRKFLPIDLYGSCGERKCDNKCFEDKLRSYKFYLALENSVCNDYVTEKFNRIKKLIVPIVFREKDYLNILPKGSYIALDQFSSFKEIAQNITFLLNNTEEYLKYFEWTKHYLDNRHEGVFDRSKVYCKLCENLYDNQFSKVYPDIGNWWVDQKCDKNFVQDLLQRHKFDNKTN